MPKSKKPIQITKRDKVLLESVRDFGLVSTEHVRYLLFSSFSRARKRLRQLWQHGFLVRIERPTRLGEGTKTKLYCMNGKGSNFIGVSSPTSGSIPRLKSISSTYAEHQLCINRFRVCLNLATKKTPGLSLVNWTPDRQVKMLAYVQGRDSRLTVPIVPDGSFTLWSGNRSYGYFLELDRGTASVKGIRSKILGYHELFVTPKSQNASLHPGFRVLIVTNSARRQDRILSVLQGLPARVRRPDIFLVTCHDKFSYEAPEALLGSIWTVILNNRSLSPGYALIPSLRRSLQCQVNHQCAGQNPIPRLGTGPGG